MCVYIYIYVHVCIYTYIYTCTGDLYRAPVLQGGDQLRRLGQGLMVSGRGAERDTHMQHSYAWDTSGTARICGRHVCAHP